MNSRPFLICLALAFSTLTVSEVALATRELAETSTEDVNNKEDSANEVEKSQYGGYPGGGYGGYPGRGYEEYPRGDYGGYPGGGYEGPGAYREPGDYGGWCPYGCCGRGYRGCRCCSYTGEAVDADLQNQP